MQFDSLEYLLFLPITFLLYWFVIGGKRRTAQNIFIVFASYLFYGLWDWRFLFLIAITTVCSYYSGIAIERYKSRKLFLYSNITLNIAILALFKYYNFFAENFESLMSKMGVHVDDITLDLILPVGISFYTFQALSYTIDVYKKKLPPTHDVIAFFAFISFFPQLVAGPIERATNLLPQFLRERTFKYEQGCDGMRQILWGLFKKMVVADSCAIVVNDVFNNIGSYDGTTLMVGAVLFAFQIYGDFSGYSDIAIGTAKLFGVSLMQNFKTPYFSRDIAEFWRKWHISLTTWFRDYIYIPLGGSRCEKWKVVRNTFVIFLVSGMWHGANWTFLAWGGYHALLFMPLILANKNRKYVDVVADGRAFPSFRELLSIIITFILVVIGWVIFRASDINEAFLYLYRMFTHFTPPSHLPGKFALFWVLIMVVAEWLQRSRHHAFDFQLTGGVLRFVYVRWIVYIVTFILCIGMTGVSNPFIYFQF